MNDFFTILYRLLLRPKNILMAFFMIFTISITLLFLFKKDLFVKESSSNDRSNFFIIGLAIATMAGVLPLVVKFLYSEKKYTYRDEFDINYPRKIKEQLQVEKKLGELINNNVTVEKIQDLVYDRTVLSIEKALIAKIEDKYEKFINFDLKHTLISNQLQPIIRDTEKYIDKLQRNSIVNLIIGIMGTITAITILAITILGNNGITVEIKDFLIHFLPRLTFVVFIQLFAFFFLRLYKNNLDDAKYFQNELTNLNSKSAALKIANLLNNQSKVDDILKELSITERNFKLFKEETTQHLEKAKLEKEFDANMLVAFGEFLKVYKKEQ